MTNKQLRWLDVGVAALAVIVATAAALSQTHTSLREKLFSGGWRNIWDVTIHFEPSVSLQLLNIQGLL